MIECRVPRRSRCPLRTRVQLLALVLAFAVPAVAQTTRPQTSRSLSVGVLALDGVYNSELVAPIDIFHHTVFHTDPGMRVFLVGRTRDPVTTFEGQRVAVDHDLESAPPIDVLVVPSAEHNMSSDLEDERLIAWLGRRGRNARHVLSICDGAFLLAAAGLLDGRRCTTFPGDIGAFRRRFSHLDVVECVRFVADGPMITGAGGARSYDPALYLVDRLYGPSVARGVGRGMVIDWDLERVRHLEMPAGPRPTCLLPGERLPGDVTVESADGRPVRLVDVVGRHPNATAVVLVPIAGGEARPSARRGGFWCEDSYSEVPNLRHLRLRYADRGVLFIGVLCPPVHHERQFGYDEGAFAATADAATYERNRIRFVEASQRLAERDALPFDEVLYDPRFRLLGTPSSADANAPSWQGRLKWFADTQTYGTPTIWVLDATLGAVGPPFFMNVYESQGRKLRYSPDDVAAAIDAVLAGGD